MGEGRTSWGTAEVNRELESEDAPVEGRASGLEAVVVGWKMSGDRLPLEGVVFSMSLGFWLVFCSCPGKGSTGPIPGGVDAEGDPEGTEVGSATGPGTLEAVVLWPPSSGTLLGVPVSLEARLVEAGCAAGVLEVWFTPKGGVVACLEGSPAWVAETVLTLGPPSWLLVVSVLETGVVVCTA